MTVYKVYSRTSYAKRPYLSAKVKSSTAAAAKRKGQAINTDWAQRLKKRNGLYPEEPRVVKVVEVVTGKKRKRK